MAEGENLADFRPTIGAAERVIESDGRPDAGARPSGQRDRPAAGPSARCRRHGKEARHEHDSRHHRAAETRQAELAAEAGEPIPVGRKLIQGRSPWQLAWERLRTDRAAIIAAATIAVIVLFALLAPLIATWVGHGPNQQFIDIGEDANGNPVPPERHLLVRDRLHRAGTCSSGSSTARGSRSSVGVLATLISVALGMVFGLAAGYLGGVVDILIARLIDVDAGRSRSW